MATTAKIKGLPVFRAVLTDAECGMKKISLVDAPAVESDFLAFEEDKMQVKYSVQDEEKHLCYGVIMRANFPIYRYDERRGEYFIIYEADTIREMAEKYLVESRQNNVNTMHGEDTDVEGVHLVQYFIKDTAKGINPEGFEAIEDGSLFAEFHVVSDDIWAEVKAGTYKGFSLEGVFALAPIDAVLSTEKIQDFIDYLEDLGYNKINKEDMAVIEKLKAKLAEMVSEGEATETAEVEEEKKEETFGSVTTDKGLMAWEGDEPLKVGDKFYAVSEDGEKALAESDTYTTEDGHAIRVEAGEVKDIVSEATEQANAEEAPAAAPEAEAAEEEETAMEVELPEEAPEIEVEVEAAEGESDIERRLALLENVCRMLAEWLGIVIVDEQGNYAFKEDAPKEFTEVLSDIAALRTEVDAFRKEPAAKPAHETFKQSAVEAGSRKLTDLFK